MCILDAVLVILFLPLLIISDTFAIVRGGADAWAAFAFEVLWVLFLFSDLFFPTGKAPRSMPERYRSRRTGTEPDGNNDERGT